MYPYTAKNLFTCRAPKLHLLLNLEEKLFITLKLKRKKKTHTKQPYKIHSIEGLTMKQKTTTLFNFYFFNICVLYKIEILV